MLTLIGRASATFCEFWHFVKLANVERTGTVRTTESEIPAA